MYAGQKVHTHNNIRILAIMVTHLFKYLISESNNDVIWISMDIETLGVKFPLDGMSDIIGKYVS